MAVHRWRPFAVLGWCAACATLSAAPAAVCAQQAAAAPPSIEDFFRNPAFDDARLSPEGKRLAVIVGISGRRRQLAVLELGALEKTKIVAGSTNADIYRFAWVNDRRLIFSVADFTSAGADQHVTGYFAVDVDGSALRFLAGVEPGSTATGVMSRVMHWSTRLHSTLTDGSDDVIVYQPQKEFTRLFRLNTRTGASAALSVNAPEGTYRWVLDRSGTPRYAVATKDNEHRVLQWDKAASRWSEIARWAAYGATDDFAPFFVDFNDELYVVAGSKGTAALYLFDKATHAPQKEPLLRIDGFDFDGSLVFDPVAKKVVGVHFVSDAPNSHWFDPEMKKAQAKIDALLPATTNRISCGQCLSSPHLLVHAQSDRDPGTFYLYDVKAGTLLRVARNRPWLDPRAMGKRDLARFPARDGLSIPAWITYPPGYEKARRYPTVVLVHGGPYLRGANWLWTDDAQFLATRGYVVLEPEFRGSTGYGIAHHRAGYKQWGRAMQDDLADAARWAIGAGMTDAKRICIAGASYGGYAALMGLVRDPDLYRCAINWLGVTDIDLMYSSIQSDLPDQYKSYGMPVLIGDREKDAVQLREASPLQQATRITRPLLMAYGSEDRRVPIEHGRRFHAAVAKHNPDVEWLMYPDEGHGWLLEKNRFDFYGRVEQFLAKHLKSSD